MDDDPDDMMVHGMTGGAVVGTLICAGFALVWTAAGIWGLPRAWRLPAAALAVVISVAFESLLIPATVVWRRRRGRPADILPAVALIVGVHFFGMAVS